MAQNLDKFKSHFRDVSRPNLYRVFLNFPAFVSTNQEKVSILCKSASMPESTLGVIELPFSGRKFRIAGDREYAAWTVGIYNDVDMVTKNAFEVWHNGINEATSNTGIINNLDYMVDLSVDHLNKQGEVTKTYIFRDAWPSSIGSIELSYDSESSAEEFSVDFQISRWESPQSTT